MINHIKSKGIILFPIVFLIYIYFILTNASGFFPAESVENSNLEKSSFYNKLWYKQEAQKGLNIPYIVVASKKVDLEKIKKIDYVYYIDDRVYFLDTILAKDGKVLQELFLNQKDYEKLKEKVNRFYVDKNKNKPLEKSFTPTPEDPELGITELYWAAKGTSVAHHWAHFYEGAIFDGPRKAQYGNLLPWTAKTLSDYFSQSSIIKFVNYAFLLFFSSALIYIGIFYQIFKRFEPQSLIGPLLLIKIYILMKIGLFALFLAPGYHWYRELTTLLIFYAIFTVKDLRLNTISWILITLIGCFLIDPSFTAISMIAVMFTIVFTKKIQWKHLLALIIIILISGALLKNNIIFLMDALQVIYETLSITPEIRNKAILVICISIFGIYLNLASGFAKNYIYFNFVSLLSFLYFLVTPDHFHYLKWLEYSIPMLGVLVFNIFFLLKSIRIETNISFHTDNVFLKNMSQYMVANRASIYAVLLIIVMLYASMNIFTLINTKNRSYHLNLFLNQQIFFNANVYKVNQREIGLNMSASNMTQLKNFPVNTPFDYLISKNDQFILFLYDKKNNFGNVDFLISLDENLLKKTQEKIMQSKTTILLDNSNFDVDGHFGILRDSYRMDAKNVSYLNYKNKIRLYHLSDFVRKNCVNLSDIAGWSSYRCGKN